MCIYLRHINTAKVSLGCAVQLLLEEFGKWVKKGTAATEAERDNFYSLVYNAVRTVTCHTCYRLLQIYLVHLTHFTTPEAMLMICIR